MSYFVRQAQAMGNLTDNSADPQEEKIFTLSLFMISSVILFDRPLV